MKEPLSPCVVDCGCCTFLFICCNKNIDTIEKNLKVVYICTRGPILLSNSSQLLAYCEHFKVYIFVGVSTTTVYAT